MIGDAVLLAAGMGTRLRRDPSDPPKPLTDVAGRTLIGRAIDSVTAAGIRRIHVIVGFRGDEVRAAVERDPAIAGCEVSFIVNDEYERSLGISVSKARGHLDRPFLLSMTDHLFDASLARAVVAADTAATDLYLCVDRDVPNVVGIEDATLVKTEGDRLVDLDKQLPGFDCVDCGVFAAGPALLEELAAARAELGNPTLSDGVKRLAKRGRARVLDITGNFWLDVDTPDELALARTRLGTSGGKPR